MTSEKPPGQRTVTVDFGRGVPSGPLPPTSNFFFEEILDALGEIAAHVRAIPKAGTSRAAEEKHQGNHRSFLVHGGRGAGKTTFMQTIAQAIDDATEPNGWECRDAKDTEVLKRVCTLPLLDPTLIEHAELMLVTVTTNILRHVHRRLGRRRPDNYEAFERALEQLAEGFPVLAGDAAQRLPRELSADPMELSRRLLHGALSGLDLAQRFAEFVATACEVLGVDAFMQPIDDVDMAMSRGWQVLETLRRYLCSDRFITVVSGDPKLFEIVVRAEQGRSLAAAGSALGDRGGERRQAERDSQLDNISYQYLLKLFPVDRRIRVKTLQETLWHRGARLDVRLRWRHHATAKEGDKLVVLLSRCAELLFGGRFAAVSGDADGAEVLNPRRSSVAWLLPPNTRALVSVLAWLEPLGGASEAWEKERAEARMDPGLRWASRLASLSDINRNEAERFELPAGLVPELVRGHGLGALAAWMVARADRARALYTLDPLLLRNADDAEGLVRLAALLQAALNVRWAGDVADSMRYVLRVAIPVQHALEASVGGTAGGSESAEPLLGRLRRLELDAHAECWRVVAAWRVQTLFGSVSGTPIRIDAGPGYLRLPNRMRGNTRELALARLAPATSKDGKATSKDGKAAAAAAAAADASGILGWWDLLSKRWDKHNISSEGVGKSKLDMLFAPSWDVLRRRAPSCERVIGWFAIRYSYYNQAALSVDLYRGLATLTDFLATRADYPVDWAPSGEDQGASGDGAPPLPALEELRALRAYVERTAAEPESSPVVVAGGRDTDLTTEDESTEGDAEEDFSVEGGEGASEPEAFSPFDEAMLTWHLAVTRQDLTLRGREPIAWSVPLAARTQDRLQRVLTRLWEGVPDYLTVGRALDLWVSAFLNSVLIEELSGASAWRDGDGAGKAIVGSLTDRPVNKPGAALQKNVELLATHLKNRSESGAWPHEQMPGLVPWLFWVWASCPALLAVLSPATRGKVLDLLALLRDPSGPDNAGEGAADSPDVPDSDATLELSRWRAALGVESESPKTSPFVGHYKPLANDGLKNDVPKLFDGAIDMHHLLCAVISTQKVNRKQAAKTAGDAGGVLKYIQGDVPPADEVEGTTASAAAALDSEARGQKAAAKQSSASSAGGTATAAQSDALKPNGRRRRSNQTGATKGGVAESSGPKGPTTEESGS